MKILIVDDHTTLHYIKESLPTGWQGDAVIVNDLEPTNRISAFPPSQLTVMECSAPEHEIFALCNEFKNRFNNFSYAVLLSDDGLDHLPAKAGSTADKELDRQNALLKAIINGVDKQKPVHVIQTDADKHEPLTGRQLEVLKLMAQGYSNEEIAGEFGITTGTVKSHVNQIFEKLSVNSRSKAVVKAARLALL